jgi:hypothetical protein
VLDHPRVAAGRPGADRVSLEEDHPSTGLGQVRGSSDADDAAAQDDDIGRVGRRLLVHPAIMASCARGVLAVPTLETANAPAGGRGVRKRWTSVERDLPWCRRA